MYIYRYIHADPEYIHLYCLCVICVYASHVHANDMWYVYGSQFDRVFRKDTEIFEKELGEPNQEETAIGK